MKRSDSRIWYEYGKGITTHVFSSAIHSRIVKRTSSNPNLRDTSGDEEEDCHRKVADINGDYTCDTGDHVLQHSIPSPYARAKSKMSKFKSPDKPKIPCHNGGLAPRRSLSCDLAVNYARRRSKPTGNGPLFPCDYSKPLRSTSLTDNRKRSRLMERIQLQFPVFREKETGDAHGTISSPLRSPKLSSSAVSKATPISGHATAHAQFTTETYRGNGTESFFTDPSQYHRPMENPITNLESRATTSSECRFVKDDLRLMRVIGQVDKKFIVGKSVVNGKKALVLFDQHAVHERIRLEQLIEEQLKLMVKCHSGMDPPLKSTLISPPLELNLSETEVRIVGLYEYHFENNGIRIEVRKDSSDVLIHSIPILFIERISSEPTENRDDKLLSLVQCSIQLQVQHILETKGHAPQISNKTYDLLRSQACRGAIMFGDHLDLDTCQKLIDQLAQCNSPFQCAHGRPVLTPLLDLTSIPGTATYQAEISCSYHD